MTEAVLSIECPKCGNAFACCGLDGSKCWCVEVALSTSARSYLAANFDGCLCPDCLKLVELPSLIYLKYLRD
jgi:hypothetical protein